MGAVRRTLIRQAGSHQADPGGIGIPMEATHGIAGRRSAVPGITSTTTAGWIRGGSVATANGITSRIQAP